MSTDKKLTVEELRELEPQKLFELWQKENSKDKEVRDLEYANTIFNVIDEIHKATQKEHQLIDYFNNTKPNKISINYTKELLEIDDKSVAEDVIANLIKDGKVSEEKAFYALSMQKVASIYSSLKTDNQEIKATLNDMQQSLEELKTSNADADKIKTLEKEIEKKENSLEESNRNIGTLNDKIREMQKELDAITSQNEELKANSSMTPNKEADEILNSLSELLNIKSEDINPVTIKEAFDKSKSDNSVNMDEHIPKLQHEEALEEEKNKNEAMEMSLKKAKEEVSTLKEKLEEATVKSSENETLSVESSTQEETSTDESEDEPQKKPSKMKSKIIKISLIAAAIGGIGFSAVSYLPNDLKMKLNTVLGGMPTVSNQETVLPSPEEVEVAEAAEDVTSQPTKEKSTQEAKTTINGDDDILGSEEISIVNDSETPAEINNSTSEVEVAQEITPKPAKNAEKPKLTNFEILSEMKSEFKVSPNKILGFRNESYKKGDTLNGFKIAYITSGFILFIDRDNKEKIHKIIL